MRKIFTKLMLLSLFAVPMMFASAATTVITGNTSAGENQPGWMFNRDLSTSTPFEFNTTSPSIGTGSLYVKPIGSTASDKFVAENFINSPISDVDSISYDFKIGSGGASTQEEQFYMNVYANFGVSDDLKFYDCRYNVVPTIGSTGSFTTVTFDPTQAYPVATRGGASASPYTCPAVPADMDLLSSGSNIRMFSLNVGDTSVSDLGLDGYLDNVIVATNSSSTTYDLEPAPTSSTVRIFKYLDGAMATAQTANGVSFPMFTPTYNAPFTLGPNGWTGGDAPYQASTSPMAIGSDYSAYENTTTPLVGTTCDGTKPYALVGYSTGNTMQSASSNTVTTTAPSFTNLQGDQYVIVHNKTCTVTPPIKVHILKYLDGVMATNTSAAGFQFPMTSTWQTANLNGGVSTSGNYVLGNNHGGATDQYGADTAPMAVPANYTTSEVVGGNVVSNMNSCAPGKYLLKGYKTSPVSFAAASLAPLTVAAPTFTAISADQYVIVLNKKCPPAPTVNTPTNKNQCKKDGWKNFTDKKGKSFKNQGQCVSWVEKHKDDDAEQPVLVDTIVLNSNSMNGVNSNIALQSGKNYKFEISGTWANRPGELVDAKYTTMDSWATNTDAPSGGYMAPLLDVQVNNGFINWGTYSPSHVYNYNFVGNGSTANFRVFDGDVNTNTPDSGWYGDNVGSMTVKIYKL